MPVDAPNTPNTAVASIVLAEDNDDDRALAFRAFRQSGVAVALQVANDGQRVLELLADPLAQLPKLIFLDVKMPRLSGIDVLTALRQDPRFSATPIVMLTSSDEPTDVMACQNLGADSYIRKPVDYGEYLTVLSTVARFWLDRGREGEVGPFSLFDLPSLPTRS